MQVLVEREKLFAALKACKPTLSNDEARLVMRNFLLRAGDGELTVASADLDSAMVCRIPAEVGANGVTTAPGEQLYRIVERAGADKISLRLSEDEELTVVSGAYKARLSCLVADDFPTIPEIGECVEVQREGLVSVLSRVGFAVCQETSKQVLMMVRILSGKAFASTTHVSVAADFPQPGLDLSIPSVAVKDLMRFLRGSGEPTVKVGESSGYLLFGAGADLFLCRKTSANFPDMVGRVLKPTAGNPLSASLPRKALIDAVGRVSCTASDRSRVVVLQWVGDGSDLLIRAYDRGGNRSEERLTVPCPVSTATGKPVKMPDLSLDFARLLEVLSSLEGDDVVLRAADEQRIPLRFDEPGFTVLLMRLAASEIATVEEDTVQEE